MQLPPPLRSSSHPLARQARLLARGPKQRRDERLFLVEGPRAIGAALDARAPLVWVLVASPLLEHEDAAALLRRCLDEGIPVQPAQQGLVERISPTVSGSGLLAACRLPDAADDDAAVLAARGGALVVVPWGVQDPGNLGTLVRSAAAFGAAGCVAVSGADPWNPKAVRASAGAIHTLPVARRAVPEGAADALAGAGYRLVAAAPRGGADAGGVDWSGRVALLLGAEVAGLPAGAVARSEVVSIPMSEGVESLSVAVAGSILLFTAAGAR